jgi:hypothetical protein
VEVRAPPNQNDTEAYARCVAKASGFGIDEPPDLHDYACLRPILTAMIRVENGRQPYTDAQIDAALVLLRNVLTLLRWLAAAADVARASVHLALSAKTTAAVLTVDGGNIAAAAR